MEYNIYCDESCHLENDPHKAMVLGAVWCASHERKEIFERIKEIKIKHGLKSDFEIKWNKVSNTKLPFYREVINFFFDTGKLHFRALVVADKNELNHEEYEQTHDDFYYKMYFDMLKIIIRPYDEYNIYLDIKDTNGYEKVERLHDVICTAHYDFSKNIIKKIQEVRSDEVSILQITDLLIGALSYFHRDLQTNEAKVELIQLIQRRSGYNLEHSTLPSESKFNLLFGTLAMHDTETTEIYELPELIELNDFGGDIVAYLEEVYQIFKEDFVETKPTFQGTRLGLKKFPLIEGKEYTFYHMTHYGDIENDRTPDMRRMERMTWPRPLIDDSKHPYLKVWRNTRRGRGGTKERILILHTKEKYLVVLDDRKDYILPWTAYLLKGNHDVRKKLKEYERYKKAETASGN